MKDAIKTTYYVFLMFYAKIKISIFRVFQKRKVTFKSKTFEKNRHELCTLLRKEGYRNAYIESTTTRNYLVVPIVYVDIDN